MCSFERFLGWSHFLSIFPFLELSIIFFHLQCPEETKEWWTFLKKLFWLSLVSFYTMKKIWSIGTWIYFSVGWEVTWSYNWTPLNLKTLLYYFPFSSSNLLNNSTVNHSTKFILIKKPSCRSKMKGENGGKVRLLIEKYGHW